MSAPTEAVWTMTRDEEEFRAELPTEIKLWRLRIPHIPDSFALGLESAGSMVLVFAESGRRGELDQIMVPREAILAVDLQRGRAQVDTSLLHARENRAA